MAVFSLWHPGMPGFAVDLFASEPLDFESAWGRRVTAQLRDCPCTILSLADLLDLKRKSGRVKDLEDIRWLAELGAGEESSRE